MKHAVNFRLSEQAINILALLERKSHYSKTAIVEKALQLYAKQAELDQSYILKYAGAISKRDAETMLSSIRENKDYKDSQVDL